MPLFPLECQLADKIAGVTFRDVLGRSTGRYHRDLVDPRALRRLRRHQCQQNCEMRCSRVAGRDREVPLRIDVSQTGPPDTRKLAATNLPEGLLTVEAATEAVSAWLDPLLQGEVPEDSVGTQQGRGMACRR